MSSHGVTRTPFFSANRMLWRCLLLHAIEDLHLGLSEIDQDGLLWLDALWAETEARWDLDKP